MVRHGREATVPFHEANWIGSEIGGSQKMGVRLSFAWSGWSPISNDNVRPGAAGP